MDPTPEEAAQFISDRARENPKVRRVIEDVRLFDGLMEHPGWQRLADKIKGRKDAFTLSLATRLMAGEKIEQTEIEFNRGFYKGAEYVIGMPEAAEVSLEQAASEAWRIARREAAIEAEQASPYLTTPGGE